MYDFRTAGIGRDPDRRPDLAKPSLLLTAGEAVRFPAEYAASWLVDRLPAADVGHGRPVLVIPGFGATDVVVERGAEAVAHVKELTQFGAESVLECVGTQEALDTAIGSARPGGSIGYVGVPHIEHIDFRVLFRGNIALRGGVAPVRAYQPELLADVLAGRLDPSPVLDFDVNLDGVPEGYKAMDTRRAIKTFIRIA